MVERRGGREREDGRIESQYSVREEAEREREGRGSDAQVYETWANDGGDIFSAT